MVNQQNDGDRPSEDDRASFAAEKSAKNNGRAQVVHCSRHLCGSKDRGSGERNEVQESGKAKVHDRFPGRRYLGRRR